MDLTNLAASSSEMETPASYTLPSPSSHETLLSFLAMNPSRLETMCKVTRDPVAFPSPNLVPPGGGLTSIRTLRADRNNAFRQKDRTRNLLHFRSRNWHWINGPH